MLTLDNGDMSWIVPGKLMAFSSPASFHRDGLSPQHFIPIFQSKGIQGIARLNELLYNEQAFEREGIRVYDLEYPDGSCAKDHIIKEFLQICEEVIDQQGKGIAVHCRAGLGRTGTLIGCYILSKYNIFDGESLIGWMRIARPGMLIGPQQ